MKKYFYYLAKDPINQEVFNTFMSSLGHEIEIKPIHERFGCIEAEADFFLAVDSKLIELITLLNNRMSFLAGFNESYFVQDLAKQAFIYFPNQIVFPSDVIMKEMSFGDYRSYPMIKDLFSKLDGELFETAGTYLRCGLDAIAAAERLKIHRNTFSYRINKFVELTSLDIRDYHNALILELYFQLIE